MIKGNKIGAFEAKAKLSELLRETEQGRSFTILRRGKAVARLVPPEHFEESDLKGCLERFREIRSRVKGTVKVKDLIREGRRY